MNIVISQVKLVSGSSERGHNKETSHSLLSFTYKDFSRKRFVISNDF